MDTFKKISFPVKKLFFLIRNAGAMPTFLSSPKKTDHNVAIACFDYISFLSSNIPVSHINGSLFNSPLFMRQTGAKIRFVAQIRRRYFFHLSLDILTYT